MSEDFNDNKTIQAQSSETISGGGSGIHPDIDYVRPAEIPEQDLYHGHSFITKWVFCQDAKVIGVQYFLLATFTGIIGLILSWLMRLQLGFPELAGFMTAEHYYQFVTMHGMIMVVYFLTALFLGGFGNFLIPLMVGIKKLVPSTLSKLIINAPTKSAGKANIAKTVAVKIPQTVRGILINVIPLVRACKTVIK